MKYCLALLIAFSTAAFSQEFESLMGKGTKHWEHVQSVRDQQRLGSYKALYEKNKHYLLSSSKDLKIPHVIHFIWLGERAFPAESVENVRTWMAHHPNWRFKFWTDRERDPPCHGMERILVAKEHMPHLFNCFEESENFGEKSDILRYEILLREGGTYVDHDANCLRSFANLHGAFDLYCGLETPHPPFASECITLGNGVVGSRPGHPVISSVVDLIAKRWEERGRRFQGRDPSSKVERVLHRTYIALTDALSSNIDKENNVDIVLPAAYFFAKQGLDALYSKHFFANSWSEGKNHKASMEKKLNRKIAQLEKKNREINQICFVVLFLNGLFFTAMIITLRKHNNV